MSEPLSLVEAVRARVSCRSFAEQPLAPEQQRALQGAIDALGPGPFGSAVRVALVTPDGLDAGVGRKLGTYGVVRGASSYLVGCVAEGPRDMEDFGWVFERVILEATRLGLGTVWLGGTFRRGAFGEAVAASEVEVVPAVTPVGTPAARRTVVDRMFRWAAGSRKRKPFEELVSDADTGAPLAAAEAGPLADALELVRIGPSASNLQPWRLALDRGAGSVHLYLLRTPRYASRFAVDLQRIDMGIAMAHLGVGAAAAGLSGAWRKTPEAAPAAPPLRAGYVATWTPA